ncbi:hypothetical protein MNBD_NITROSPINAE04-2240 [hydrothermal vent metagenome]|uniref:DUF1844 domain-containing protein n=1 Tax=hydrothermal vent metagenome TaxID=652676 RepID=A0A3B1C2X3_9ZZZZ
MGDLQEPEEGSFKFQDKRRRFDEDDSAAEEPEDAPEPEIVSPSEEIKPESGPETEGDAAAPPINFSTFILSLASSAAYHMGGFHDEVSGKTSVNLDLAKQSIDILAILEEKTKGNLNEEEANLLTHSLYDLRMKFVEMSKK